MDNQITVSAFALYRLERAKQDLDDAEFSYENHRYLNANNRAYYAIFHAMRAVIYQHIKLFTKNTFEDTDPKYKLNK